MKALIVITVIVLSVYLINSYATKSHLKALHSFARELECCDYSIDERHFGEFTVQVKETTFTIRQTYETAGNRTYFFTEISADFPANSALNEAQGLTEASDTLVSLVSKVEQNLNPTIQDESTTSVESADTLIHDEELDSLYTIRASSENFTRVFVSDSLKKQLKVLNDTATCSLEVKVSSITFRTSGHPLDAAYFKRAILLMYALAGGVQNLPPL